MDNYDRNIIQDHTDALNRFSNATNSANNYTLVTVIMKAAADLTILYIIFKMFF